MNMIPYDSCVCYTIFGCVMIYHIGARTGDNIINTIEMTKLSLRFIDYYPRIAILLTLYINISTIIPF